MSCSSSETSPAVTRHKRVSVWHVSVCCHSGRTYDHACEPRSSSMRYSANSPGFLPMMRSKSLASIVRASVHVSNTACHARRSTSLRISLHAHTSVSCACAVLCVLCVCFWCVCVTMSATHERLKSGHALREVVASLGGRAVLKVDLKTCGDDVSSLCAYVRVCVYECE